MSKYTIIGDIHGKVQPFLSLLEKSSYPVIQVGDVSISEVDFKSLNSTWKKKKFYLVGGNHDHYPCLVKSPAYLGDFGLIPGTSSTFFIRGAYSIDKAGRVPWISWWEDEELTYPRMVEAADKYAEILPEVMITHDCPQNIIGPMFGINVIKTATGRLLQHCFEYHQPKLWLFGHHHRTMEREFNGCKFVCLGELMTIDMELP